VQNRTEVADVAVKYSEKTARGPTIATEILAFRPSNRKLTAKATANNSGAPYHATVAILGEPPVLSEKGNEKFH
jgi:hypothetical protein